MAFFASNKEKKVMGKIVTLKKNYEFKKVFSRGKYISGDYLCIYVIKNRLNTNKLGIAISKKVGKAVKRNKIRRIIRENYRLIKETIGIGHNIVIIWKKNIKIEEATFANIQKDMKKTFEKAKLI